MAEKRNIFLVGPMGAGKSTIGRQLAQQLNMEFFDSDQEIERRTGADVGWVFDVEGEEGFRDREEKVINELTEKQRDCVGDRRRFGEVARNAQPSVRARRGGLSGNHDREAAGSYPA